MSKKKIVVVGSSNTDMIIALDRIPQPGETILGGEFHTSAGGKGANQAVSAARAGGAVTFIARVGPDSWGEQAVAGFAESGIDVRQVIRDKTAPSGVALIFVAKSGQNSIAVAGGANNRLSVQDVKKARAVIAGAAMLVLQLETPLATVEAAVAIARKAGVPVMLNPAPAQKLPDSLLRSLSILNPNETEAELLTGIKITDVAAAAKAGEVLLQRGVETVIITLGANGAWVGTKDTQFHVPGFKVKAVDTTAAGDTFSGALAVALAEGKALKEAVRFASAAAALSVTKQGAQTAIPTRTQIDKFLKSQKA